MRESGVGSGCVGKTSAVFVGQSSAFAGAAILVKKGNPGHSFRWHLRARVRGLELRRMSEPKMYNEQREDNQCTH